MTDVTEPSTEAPEDPLDELAAAMTAQPVITRPEDLKPEDIPQIPYEKTDRVPDGFQPLEAVILESLAEELGRPVTPGMLRMMRGRTVATGATVTRLALFEVLATEGGPVEGWVHGLEVGAARSSSAVLDQDAALKLHEMLAASAEEDAAFAAKTSTCRACPPGCNDCTKDQDCECYEHGVQYSDPDD